MPTVNPNEKENLAQKYKEKGAQRLSIAEYVALQEKKEKAAIKVPKQIKVAFSIPFLILFAFGVVFVPYMIFLIATSPTAKPKQTATDYDVIMKKKAPSEASSAGSPP
jgi:hypothetical protein